MWVAMTRSANWLDKPLHPEQALSRVEAIRFYTINNAYLTFSEKERGSLEPGNWRTSSFWRPTRLPVLWMNSRIFQSCKPISMEKWCIPVTNKT